MPRALASKWARKPSNEPKCSSIRAPTSPSGLSPPSGERLGQKIEWLTCPPRLKARFFSSMLTDRAHALVPRVGHLLQRRVGACHVRRVVLVVVQLHDLARDVRLEGAVVVGKVGQGVLSHRVLRDRGQDGCPVRSLSPCPTRAAQASRERHDEHHQQRWRHNGPGRRLARPSTRSRGGRRAAPDGAAGHRAAARRDRRAGLDRRAPVGDGGGRAGAGARAPTCTWPRSTGRSTP